MGRVHLHERLHPGAGGVAPTEHLHRGRRLHCHLTAAGLLPLPFMASSPLVAAPVPLSQILHSGKDAGARGCVRPGVNRLVSVSREKN